MSREDSVGPKELALREMRERRLKQIMNPTKTKIDYAGKGKGDNHPPKQPQPKVPAKPNLPKTKRKSGSKYK